MLLPRLRAPIRAALLAVVPTCALLAASVAGGTPAPDATAAKPPSVDEALLCADLATLASDAMNGRSFRSDDGRRAAAWVAERFAEAGLEPLAGRDSMLVPIGRAPDAAPNVVGWLPPKGASPDGDCILVTAHYDHLPPKRNAKDGEDAIFNGADDNASGVAGMIAVARALREATLDAGVVFVAFTGEEAGLVGSRAFVEEETVPAARIRGVFNMDMISRQPDGAIRLDGGPVGKPLVDLLARLAPSVPIEMKVDTHPDWLPRSDQGAFLAAGIPAVLFSCEDHEDYHQVSDHADRADCALAARVATLVALAVPAWAAEMPPRFDRSSLLDESGRPRRAVRVGRTASHAPYWTPARRRMPAGGLDRALVARLAERLGWTIEERAVPEGGEVEALRSGEVDLVANGFLATAARRDAFALTIPYFEGSGVGALVKADSSVREPVDLDARTVAAMPGGPEARWAADATDFAARLVDATGPIGVRAALVESGAADALLGDFAALETRARRDPAVRAVRLAALPTVLALRTEDRATADLLSREIAALEASGELARMRAAAGVTTHRVLGQDRGRFVILGHSGAVEWEYPSAHNAHDIEVLPNGNLLLHVAPDRIREVTPAKETVWEWTSRPVAPYDGPVEIHGFQRLPNGDTMIAETGNLRIVEVDPKGAIVRVVPIRSERPDWHHDTRRVRKTDLGTYLVCHEPLGLVREYDADGGIVWEYALPLIEGRAASGGQQGHGTAVFHAIRLANGNTLVGGGNNNRVLEVTPAKEIVWSAGPSLKAPDGTPIELRWVTSLQALPNGNVVIGNTHGGPGQPQLVEVTRKGEVVWTLTDWRVFGNDLCTGWCLDLPEGTRR